MTTVQFRTVIFENGQSELDAKERRRVSAVLTAHSFFVELAGWVHICKVRGQECPRYTRNCSSAGHPMAAVPT